MLRNVAPVSCRLSPGQRALRLPLCLSVKQWCQAVARARYSGTVSEQAEEKRNPRVGLCEHCRFMRRIESDRGSTFYMCLRSATDPEFPKYPRLPVLRCSGYEQLTPENNKSDQ